MENFVHAISSNDDSSQSTLSGMDIDCSKARRPKLVHNVRAPMSTRDPESIQLVSLFMANIRKGNPKGRKNQELAAKRKQRKREINRASAKRKRIREKEELESLASECRRLEALDADLKAQVSFMAKQIEDERVKKEEYMRELTELRAAKQGPPPAPLASSPLDPNSILGSLNQTQKAQQTRSLLAEFEQLEQTRQAILAREASRRRMADLALLLGNRNEAKVPDQQGELLSLLLQRD